MQDTLLTIVKPIAATPTEIYQAWTDPSTIGEWLFRTPDGALVRSELEPRVGGQFAIVERRGEQLAEHFGTFTQLDSDKRIAFDFHMGDEAATHIDISLEPEIYGTEVTFNHKIDPDWIDYKEQTIKGWNIILDNLANRLTANRHFSVTKQIAANKAIVFDALMDADTLPRWFVCETMSMPTVEMDVREGGKYRLEMKMESHQFAFIGEYLKIVPNAEYLFTQIYDVVPYNNSAAIVTSTFSANDGGTELTERIDFPSQPHFDGAAATGMESGMDETLERFKRFVESR